MYKFVGLECCKNVGVSFDSLVEIESLGQGCFCIPAGEGFVFSFGSPGCNLRALVDLLFFEKLAALVPAYSHFVCIVGLVRIIGRARCEANEGECEHHNECDCR